MLGAPQRVFGFSQRQRAQASRLRQRALFTQVNQLAGFHKITGRERPELRRDEHVLRLQGQQTLAHVLFGQDVDHLPCQAAQRTQCFAPRQRRADVHHYHHIGTHGARHVYRQVVDQTAVAQDAPAHLGRREHTRHAHAGAQGQRQIAVAKHHRQSTLHVGGHRPKWNAQAVEIAHQARRQGVAAQQPFQPST